jgi:FecR-like protein
MSDEERIQRLLRVADAGPAIPAGGEERIRAAVRPLWQTEVRKRSARRVLVSATLAAAAAALLFFIPFLMRSPVPAAPPMPVARVELVRGPLDRSLQQKVLFAGSRVRTPPGGRAALRVAQGSSLRLDSDTTIRLVSAHVVELEHGAIYIDSGGLSAQPMEVRTRFGVVRDVGTRFEVRAEDHLLVRVREGSVHVDAHSQDFLVKAGFESQIESDGSQAIKSSTPHRNTWTSSVAPPIPIEGRSVAALLDWCSRESGLAVRYGDREAEHIALTTLLHGSMNDLQPVEAAEVILPTAGLQVARGNGELVIGVESPRR